MSQTGTLDTLLELSLSRSHLTGCLVLSYLVRQGFPAKPELQKRVRRLRPQAHKELSAKALGCVVPVDVGNYVSRSELPASIHRADKLGVGLCTVGEGIDVSAETLRKDGRYIDAWVLDTYGILALNQLSDSLARKMWAWASTRGYRASRAYAPGVAPDGWDLSGQQCIFRLLPADRIDVHLKANLWMHPMKTRSFVIGIGTHVEQADTPFSCGNCNDETCIHRRMNHEGQSTIIGESGGSQ